MQSEKVAVNLTLVTEIIEGKDKQLSEVEANGFLYTHNERSIIMYSNNQEGHGEINNLVTIDLEKVSIKRSGAIDMHQQFKLDQRTENVYRHEFGTLHMETFTDAINFCMPNERKKGQLNMRYRTKINGEGERKHRITLMIEEEK